ncbi:MAG: HlyD family efflux transporter periplasmic adaptor subunit, partial [Desulfovibrio sp.]|nr:HlyD family efflux transporter periplasmic adaptor subunit [Desulfovibrio sp.]
NEVIVEMAPQSEKRNFFRSRTWIIILICLGLVMIAALASWWTARGRISSVTANVDALIYTVEPKEQSQIERIFVHPGDMVRQGQALARIDYPKLSEGAPNAPEHFVGTKPAVGISERLLAVRQAEMEMAQKVNQARDQEEKLRLVYQDLVAEHARSQLAMRSIDMRNRGAYEQARIREEGARANMERARDTFEQYSRMRAAQDAELKKIRAELRRVNQKAGEPASLPSQTQQTPMLVENDLLSPVSGKVMKIMASPGQIIAAGQPVFVILPSGSGQASGYWIQAWFPLSAAGEIKPGQKASVHILNRDLNLAGKVASVADEAQELPSPETGAVNNASLNKEDKGKFNSLRFLPVKISLDNLDAGIPLEPGTKVNCQIQTRHIPGLGFLD